jgi:hypothetical protein
MAPKHKALIYNFLTFAILFVLFRFLLDYLFSLERFVLAVISAILATILAPKFAVVKTANGVKMFVKWPFKKIPREM